MNQLLQKIGQKKVNIILIILVISIDQIYQLLFMELVLILIQKKKLELLEEQDLENLQ